MVPTTISHIAFGPVPSRRLGQSLGVNNIPAKHCSYSCVYCQVGPTRAPEIEPRAFYPADLVVRAVRERVAEIRRRDQRIDYISFVPDGEPTLDRALGDEIAGVRDLGIPIAVFTNGSLLWRPEVRAALEAAAWVSVKVDAATEDAWRAIGRPAAALDFHQVVDGIRSFADEFGRALATETMLVAGVNDDEDTVTRTAQLVAELVPTVTYLTVPTRPPVEPWCRPPGDRELARAFAIFAGAGLADVELLAGFDHGRFGATGDVVADLLGVMSVHPMREREVAELLARERADWTVVEGLRRDGVVDRVDYAGERFYISRNRAPATC